MPATTKAPPRSSLREEILGVLTVQNGARIAGTAKWIANRVKAPLTAVSRELEAMRLDGTLTTRQLRSSEVLWKRPDPHHQQWNTVRSFLGRPAAHV